MTSLQHCCTSDRLKTPPVLLVPNWLRGCVLQRLEREVFTFRIFLMPSRLTNHMTLTRGLGHPTCRVAPCSRQLQLQAPASPSCKPQATFGNIRRASESLCSITPRFGRASVSKHLARPQGKEKTGKASSPAFQLLDKMAAEGQIFFQYSCLHLGSQSRGPEQARKHGFAARAWLIAWWSPMTLKQSSQTRTLVVFQSEISVF